MITILRIVSLSFDTQNSLYNLAKYKLQTFLHAKPNNILQKIEKNVALIKARKIELTS